MNPGLSTYKLETHLEHRIYTEMKLKKTQTYQAVTSTYKGSNPSIGKTQKSLHNGHATVLFFFFGCCEQPLDSSHH